MALEATPRRVVAHQEVHEVARRGGNRPATCLPSRTIGQRLPIPDLAQQMQVSDSSMKGLKCGLVPRSLERALAQENQDRDQALRILI